MEYYNYIEQFSYILYPNDTIINHNDVILVIFFKFQHINYIKYLNNKYKITYNICNIQSNNEIFDYIVEIKNIHILEFLFDIFNNNLNKNLVNLYSSYNNLYKNQFKYFTNINSIFI